MRSAIFLLTFLMLAGSAAHAQIGPIIDALPDDRKFVQRMIESIPGYDDMDSMAKVRTLRERVARITPVAGSMNFLIHDKVINLPLEAAYNEMAHGGVFCGATATFLARVYTAAGFKAWTYNFGRSGILTHVTTLVEIDDEIFIQDAYLNYEYVDDDGKLIPFFSVLSKLTDKNVPKTTVFHAKRTGFFPNTTKAERWTDTTSKDAGQPHCSPVNGGAKCEGVFTLPTMLHAHFLTEPTYDFLVDRGFPREIDYLMLFPIEIISLYSDTIATRDQLDHKVRLITENNN